MCSWPLWLRMLPPVSLWSHVFLLFFVLALVSCFPALCNRIRVFPPLHRLRISRALAACFPAFADFCMYLLLLLITFWFSLTLSLLDFSFCKTLGQTSLFTHVMYISLILIHNLWFVGLTWMLEITLSGLHCITLAIRVRRIWFNCCLKTALKWTRRPSMGERRWWELSRAQERP